MQPYFFPYIGYFQLMSVVDTWVVLDDVTFINGGWINRNRLLSGTAELMFSVPLSGASQNRRICDIAIDMAQFEHWRRRFCRTLIQSYGRTPRFPEVRDLVDSVLSAEFRTIAELNLVALSAVREYLGLSARIVPTTRQYGNDALRGQERILDICVREGARTYVNAIGGTTLYSAAAFAARGIELRFLRTGEIEYDQGRAPFVPYLSILDVLFRLPKDDLENLLGRCALLSAHQV